MLGALLAEAGHVDQAIAAYRRAIELDERNFAARNNLALLLADQGDLDGALSVAQEAYALADTQPDVVDTLGWLYLKRGLVERSIALLEKAHVAAPELPAPQLHLALAYRADGRASQARRLLTDLLEGLEAGSPLGAEASAALRSLED
jgi:tetratricopeptide (TPR) repeat protein